MKKNIYQGKGDSIVKRWLSKLDQVTFDNYKHLLEDPNAMINFDQNG